MKEALLSKMILFLSTVDGVGTILIILDIARREVTQCGYFFCLFRLKDNCYKSTC